MEFKDLFSNQAREYSLHRPKYPDELFEFLNSNVICHDKAWDCATGNGQAALGLTPYFNEIIATDGSPSQIKHAAIHPKIQYKIALAESSGLEDSSIDLLTVATAIHWFNLDKFYPEVRRILKPGSVIAAWVYSDSCINEEIDRIVKNYSQNIVGSFWSLENKKAEQFEENIEFPFTRISTPSFSLIEQRTLKDYLNYLFTWSATQAYQKSNAKNPLDLIAEDLSNAWGDENIKRDVRWDLRIKVGRV